MATSNAFESKWPELPDAVSAPAVTPLPPTVPVERRNIAAREALLRRVHSEYDEMPGLCLTLAQATKLFGVPVDACSRILVRLTDERFLAVRHSGRYVRRAGTP